MNLLQLTPENREAVEKVVAFATLPENLYRPGPDARVPGQIPGHCAEIDSFRLVFSLTETKGEVYRQLTVSVPRPGRLPHPFAVFTLATWCGFTGGKVAQNVTIAPAEDWLWGPHSDGASFLVVQRLRTGLAAALCGGEDGRPRVPIRVPGGYDRQAQVQLGAEIADAIETALRLHPRKSTEEGN